MTRPRCEAERGPGRPCAGWALPGGRFCWSHEPTRAGERLEAARRGGRLRAIAYVLSVQLKALELARQSETERLLAEVRALVGRARSTA